MQYRRQVVVEKLRRAGLPELAAEAMRELPDPVELKDAQEWGLRRGITIDSLVSRMGGSP